MMNQAMTATRPIVEDVKEFGEHDWCWVYVLMSMWYENSYPPWRIQGFLAQFKWLSKNAQTQIIDLFVKAKR